MADQAQKDSFLKALAEIGGSAGNGRLRDTLGWDEATYSKVKQVLIDSGAITPGRGRGGSISIADAEAAPPPAAQAAKVDRLVRAARPNTTAANVGYEAQLWQMADALRGSMDAAEYKHVVLGLIFLKYISDAFEAKHAELEAAARPGRRPRGPGRVPRRERLLGAAGGALAAPAGPGASSRRSAQLVDDAMDAIERDNPKLKGVLPRTTPARRSTSSGWAS